MPKKPYNVCTFCGRPIKNNEFSVNGIYGIICEECTEEASEILKNYQTQTAKTRKSELKFKLLKPIEIKEKLDE